MKLGNRLKFSVKFSSIFYVVVFLLFSSPVFCENQGEVSPRLKEILQKNIHRTITALPKAEQKAKEVAEWVSLQKDKNVRFGNPGPEENPLDKLQGHLDQATSWHEYKADSKIILNDLTFPQCMEPRLVAKGIGHTTIESDGVNKLYEAACKAHCIDTLPFGLPILIPPEAFERWQVISYYWPEYQLSVNKAGAQMIDPEIVGEKRADELYRLPTSIAEDTADQRRNRETQKEFLKKMGLPSDLIKDPDWHKAGEEFHLQQDGEVRYVSAMRPNAMWRAANKRPFSPFGWTLSPSCLFDALDPPTTQKSIVANRYDQGIYAVLARYPETRQLVDPERYRKTSPLLRNIDDYRNSTPTDFLTNHCVSYQLGSNPQVYGDLAKVGVKPINDPSYKDYCLPGGYSLSGSMASTENTPFLQGDAVRVAMAVNWFSDTKGALSRTNTAKLRLPRFTYYTGRKAGALPRFVNFEINPGENKSGVVTVDKLQRIYPTQPMFGIADGIGGASSEGGQRVTEGQRGSHCFRPEDIPNWSSEGKTNVEEWPLGLVQDVRKHYGETRWAMWNRRVVCACEADSIKGPGCISLNSGDFKNDSFAGLPGPGFSGQVLPDPFTKAMPIIKQLAEEEGLPGGSAPSIPDISLPAIDTLASSSTQPFMPGGKAFQPPDPNRPDPFPLICILLNDNNPNQPTQCPGGVCSANGGGTPGCVGPNCSLNNNGTANAGGGGNCANGQCFNRPFRSKNDTSFTDSISTKILGANKDGSLLIENNSQNQICKKTNEESGKSFYSCEQTNEKSVKSATSGAVPPIELFPIGPSAGSGSTTSGIGAGNNTGNNVCTGPNCGNPNNVCAGPNCGNAAQGSCANGSCQNSFVQQGPNGQQYICFFGQPPSGQCQGGTCTAPGGGCSGGNCGAPGGGCSGGTCTSGAGGGCGAGGCGGGGSGGGGFGGGGFGGIIPGFGSIPGLSGLGNLGGQGGLGGLGGLGGIPALGGGFTNIGNLFGGGLNGITSGLGAAVPGLGLPGLNGLNGIGNINGLGNLPIQGYLPNLGNIGSGGLGNLPSGLNGLPSGLSNIPNGLNSSVPSLNGIQNIPNLPTSLPNLGNNSKPKPSPSIKTSEPKPSPSPSATSVNNEAIEQF